MLWMVNGKSAPWPKSLVSESSSCGHDINYFNVICWDALVKLRTESGHRFLFSRLKVLTVVKGVG